MEERAQDILSQWWSFRKLLTFCTAVKPYKAHTLLVTVSGGQQTVYSMRLHHSFTTSTLVPLMTNTQMHQMPTNFNECCLWPIEFQSHLTGTTSSWRPTGVQLARLQPLPPKRQPASAQALDLDLSSKRAVVPQAVQYHTHLKILISILISLSLYLYSKEVVAPKSFMMQKTHNAALLSGPNPTHILRNWPSLSTA